MKSKLYKLNGAPSSINNFSDELALARAFRNFSLTAKTYHVDCKHKKNNLAAVKSWIKANSPAEYYCMILQNSTFKNDSEVIYYKESEQ